MADGESGMTSSAPSLPPPCPRSPPPYPDLYGKRRDLAKLQMLERERSFLEEELKFVEGLQPASRCCKEVVDFVASKSEPLVPANPKINRSCGLRRWLWYFPLPRLPIFYLKKASRFQVCKHLSTLYRQKESLVTCGSCCFRFSWLRCCAGCSLHPRLLECCCFNLCDCSPCHRCSVPKWQCSCPTLPCCCTKISCCKGCCKFKFPSCPSSHCCKCKCSCPKSQDVCFCYGCIKNCCDPTCCICY